ncbi:unnamed protein product [Dicrocoelium dendriticum]|nr:unnamed protein product [Dicrocoelium dendriticum]
MFSTLTSDALLEEQLPRIVEHRYKSFGKSAVEPLLEPFWKWGVTFVPKRVAPNTLTLSGLLANVFSTLIILYYSPNFRNEIPASSVLFFCAAVFLYQTLDALDGLHARRTNTCSPLGELFDHGCDAISMYVLSMGYFSIIGFGNSPIAMLVEFFILNCTFYASQWQSFVTGSMSFDGFSVTESLLFLMLVSIISAFFGVQLWTFKEPFLGIELNKIQFWIAVVGSTVLFVRFAHTISVDGVGKCGTTVAVIGCPLRFFFPSLQRSAYNARRGTREPVCAVLDRTNASGVGYICSGDQDCPLP